LTAAGDDALLEGVDVREQVVGTLSGADDVDTALMVVTYLVARSPEVTRLCHLLIVHDGRYGRLIVPGTIGRRVHVAAGTAEGIPDVTVATIKVLDAHVTFLVFDDAIPDAHQTLHLVGLSLRN
jgi:hypothetical protein